MNSFAPPALYSEMVCATHFSFLRGASSAPDLVFKSLISGHSGLGIADRNSLAGVVRAWSALRDLREGGILPPHKQRIGSAPGEFHFEPYKMPPGPEIRPPDPPQCGAFEAEIQKRAKAFKLATGARLAFMDSTPDIVAYPENRAGWGQLCRLITLGNRRAKKGDCHLRIEDLCAHLHDLALIVIPGRDRNGLGTLLARLQDAAPGSVWLGATMTRRGDDRRQLAELARIAMRAGLPLLANNNVLYADPSARDLQDILTCIREGRTLENAGFLLEANSERHLKTPEAMQRLFGEYPEAIIETQRLLASIDFDLGQLTYEYPEEPVPPDKDPQSWLKELTFRHAAIRYPEGIPEKVEKLLHAELALIGKLDYARYFLTIHDIVRVAKDKGILCQGRGSAANSAICYVLGITCVDPAEHNVLFARFISEERKEPPDIDVDFEHERREEVIQHIYARYGRERAGLAATVIHYRPKSAIREVGKVFGLSEDVTAALSSTQWGHWGSDITRAQVLQAGLDPDNREIGRVVHYAKRLLGLPRHLSQHVGGFVLTRQRLDELVPIGNGAMADRTFIEWDKEDISALGLMKVDVLALGMLTCIRKAFDLLKAHYGLDIGLADVPANDAQTYAMLQRGDSIGVFQIESRAQINMLPRLKPREFYDLVIQVAIVRPGPIQGNMVHPYLRRRSGQERVTFPSPAPPHDPHELRNVLAKTLGVPLFQEQAMQLAMVAAEFSDVEANQLRRAMATFRNLGTIHRFEGLMVERMVKRGYQREFAQNCFEQIKGFGSYGFPESHAASFAKLVYISSWLKCHYPAVFAAALLNAQPMGFYAPAQIVRDAREHGVEVRAADINHSSWDNTLEPLENTPDQFQNETSSKAGRAPFALRLGLRQIEDFHESDASRLIEGRIGLASNADKTVSDTPKPSRPFISVEDLARRARLYGRPMRALADADAFRSIGLDRRQALWEVRRQPQAHPLPLFAVNDTAELGEEADAQLPLMSLGEHVANDYQTLRLSLKAHPLALLRSFLATEGILTGEAAGKRQDGQFIRVAGLVLVRQRPGNGKAIFITLEDETGITNCLLWASELERLRRPVMAARLMLVEGRVQKSPEGIVHLMASHIVDRSGDLDRLWDLNAACGDGSAPGDPLLGQQYCGPRSQAHHPRDARILVKSRDFH